MQFNQELSPRYFTIHGYQQGEITVNHPYQSGTERNFLQQQVIRHSFLLSPHAIREDWPELRPENITESHLRALLEMEPELVIFGTGEQIQFPPPETSAFFMTKGIGLEVMTTAAACRTYNILMHEGRRVAAALMLF